MDWKDDFKERKELVLATCSKSGSPNANIVISLGFIDNKLLVADCQMKTTLRNIKETKKIVVISEYSRLNGTVKIFNRGKYLDACIEKSKGYSVKNALLINVKRVFDLDKQKILYEK